jgi:hypothetical protein
MARLVATGEHKAKAARQMRATAALLDDHHPEMMAGDHLRDAARLISAGRADGAKRHLDAAMFMLTPQSLIRHGILDDDGHADAKHHMHQINRHRLAVEDIEDIHAGNDRARQLTRARRGEPPTDDDELDELADARLIAAVADDLLAIELSARTPYLAVTPAPRGRPGGPGLYHVKGMGHTAYLQQVVKALIEKRGMKPSKAYAIARAAIRKWSVRSRHPEVRGAATAAEAGEIARQGRAKMSHSNDWTVADVLVELACDDPAAVIDLFNPYHAPTGQFTTQQGAGQGKGKQQQRQAAKQDRRGDRAQRQALTRKIAGLHQQIAALRAQLPQHRSRSSTPAKKGAAATSAKQAAQAKATAAKAGKPGATRARKPGMSAATIHAKIAALQAVLRADIAQLRSIK